MEKYLVQAQNEEVKYWINSNLSNYLKREGVVENQSEIEHIIDFLNSEDAPQRLRKMSYSEATELSKRWLKKLIKKGMDLEEVEDVDYDVVIDFKDGFKLIRLKTELAFKREGSLMGHCVASYFGRDNTNIYSLRDSKDMPHCTMEIVKGSDCFNQVKGKGNGPIHVKYIKYVLDTLKHFGIAIRSSEMRNLGYQCFDDLNVNKEQLGWFNKNFTFETLSLNGKKYVYLNSIKEKAV